MNEPVIDTRQVYNGWEAHFRKVHKSGWHPVQVNGITQLFETEFDAFKAAQDAREKHLFGDGILRDGEKISLERSKAETLFGRIFPGKGRKPVVVERR